MKGFLSKSPYRGLMLSVFLVAVTLVTQAHALSIVGVSIPVGSMDATCHPLIDNVWSVSGDPLNVNTGIGFLINPTFDNSGNLNVSDFTLHDHVYLSPYIIDPTRAVVTYQFDAPAIVDKITIIEHANGITKIEGFVGNTLGSLVSIGSIFGPYGDVTGSSIFEEGKPYVFDFVNHSQAGSFFQFVIRKTSLSYGYAAYRAYPNAASVPEPATILLLGLGLMGIAGFKRKLRY